MGISGGFLKPQERNPFGWAGAVEVVLERRVVSGRKAKTFQYLSGAQ